MASRNIAADKTRSPAAAGKAIAALTAAFGNRVVTSQAVREQHGNTLTWVPNQPPDAVVFPQTTEDVQQIVRICAAHGVPVIPFGTGTSLEGHVNAPFGGVSIDFRDMNKVLAVHAEDLDCVIEPGITRKALNEQLRDSGLFFPIDPGADASLGGMAATRASGTNAVRYGTMKDNVLALKVVMANGELMTTVAPRQENVGRLRSHAADGRLGRHARRHHRTDAEAVRHSGSDLVAASVRFRRSRPACNATIHTIQSGIPVARIELLDALQIKAVNRLFQAGLPEMPMLFVEFHGTDASVAEQSQRFGEIAEEFGGGPFEWATKPEDRTPALAGAPRRLSGRAPPAPGRRGCSRPTSACRSRGWPNASPRRSARSPSSSWSRRSSAMSATAISISRCWSTWTTPTRSGAPSC